MRVSMRILPEEGMTPLELAKDGLSDWLYENRVLLPEWLIAAAERAIWYSSDDSHIDIMRDIVRDGMEVIKQGGKK